MVLTVHSPVMLTKGSKEIFLKKSLKYIVILRSKDGAGLELAQVLYAFFKSLQEWRYQCVCTFFIHFNILCVNMPTMTEECPICLMVNENIAVSRCGRCNGRFHTACIRQLKLCPICRFLEHKNTGIK